MATRWGMRLPGWLRGLMHRLAGGGESPRAIGARGERLAADHLRAAGYDILARNLRRRWGEIDILAAAPPDAFTPHRRTLVIVEVKAGLRDPQSRAPAPAPEVHVNAAKRRKLVTLAHTVARRYVASRTLGALRFDVIGVDLPRGGGAPTIRHHIGAFASPW